MSEDYTREVDRLMNLLEDLQHMPKVMSGEVALETHHLVNEFYYILGGIPVEEQEAFIGLALATGLVTVDGITQWTGYKAAREQRDNEKCGIVVASTDTKLVMPDMQELLYEKAYTTKRIRRVAKEKSESGDCPPEDICVAKSGEVCAQDADCEKCWVQSLQSMLDMKPGYQT